MSIFGGNLSYVDESDNLFEDCVMESVLMEAKVPEELKMDVSDYMDGSSFKKKFEGNIKWLQDNFSGKKLDKKLSKFICFSGYYGIIGNVFGTKGNTKYPNGGIAVVVKYANKYCLDKDKNRIKNDMEKTLGAFEKNFVNGDKTMSPLQKKFYEEIKANVNKL